MKAGEYSTLNWQEVKNGVTIDCSLEIAVHPRLSKVVLLTVPGVDGSVDGYEEKYMRIAEAVGAEHGVAVVRIANPFITSFHWESNVRRALEYIELNTKAITGEDQVEVRIMAHSAGAAVVAGLAWEYPQISRLLLINPATKLWSEKTISNLSEFKNGSVVIVSGELDDSKALSLPGHPNLKRVIVNNADHNFSGESFNHFLSLPINYLFNENR